MKTFMISLLVILGLLAIWFIGTNNSIVTLNENVSREMAQVESTLQRRADLIPNLVSSVKGYAAHEEKIFTDVAKARAMLAGAIPSKDINKLKEANDSLSGALGRLLAIRETYPQLKADATFLSLMDELSGTENRINYARNQFNEAVAKYNKKIKVFPASLVAGFMGFEEQIYFKANENSKTVPNVSFN